MCIRDRPTTKTCILRTQSNRAHKSGNVIQDVGVCRGILNHVEDPTHERVIVCPVRDGAQDCRCQGAPTLSYCTFGFTKSEARPGDYIWRHQRLEAIQQTSWGRHSDCVFHWTTSSLHYTYRLNVRLPMRAIPV